MSVPPVSIVTVVRNAFFFTRLLIEKVREHSQGRRIEIIVVDRGSTDGTRQWLRDQGDVRRISYRQWWTRGHGHGEAAEYGIRKARHERIVLLDSDAHPIRSNWIEESADRLDEHYRLAGAVFVDKHLGNPHGWYVHPHFMSFFKSDLGSLIVLRKVRGVTTDTGEEATIRVLARDHGIIKHQIEWCPEFSVGHSRVPTVAGGVFHAWYVSRLESQELEVARETGGLVTRATYLEPLQAKLRQIYGLSY